MKTGVEKKFIWAERGKKASCRNDFFLEFANNDVVWESQGTMMYVYVNKKLVVEQKWFNLQLIRISFESLKTTVLFIKK